MCKHFLKTWSGCDLLPLVTHRVVEVTTSCAAYAYVSVFVGSSSAHLVDTLCPVLRLLSLRKPSLRWHLVQLMWLPMLLWLLDCRRLDLWTACALYERIRTIVVIHSRSDWVMILKLAAVLPWIFKHDCHIDHSLWLLLQQAWVWRRRIHNITTFTSMKSSLTTWCWWKLL